MTMAGSLQGKRIVVTRAVEQSRHLKTRLEAMGATVLLFPAVSFAEPPDTTDLDRAIHALGDFDWVLFTSANPNMPLPAVIGSTYTAHSSPKRSKRSF